MSELTREQAQEKKLKALTTALEPFANALVEYGDDGSESDWETILSHPTAREITLGHLRHACFVMSTSAVE